MNRSRTFHWADPNDIAVRARSTPGLELLSSIAGRERMQAAPVAECLGFQLVEASEGRVVFELEPREYHYNPLGGVHGGVLATLCDSATGAAVHSTLPAGTGYASLDLNVRFVRPVTLSVGVLRCEGVVLSRGKRVAHAEARLSARDGKLYAHATSTCLVVPSDRLSA